MKSKKAHILFSLVLISLLVVPHFVSAQNMGQIGINILNPDSSAILHLESTDKGFLPPVMTTDQRDSISNPAEGLVIYNNEDSVLQVYNGECWIATWQRNCDDCYFTMDLDKQTGDIDRIFTDTTGTDITITQVAGNPTTIGLLIMGNLPQGITATLDTYVVNGSGTVHLTVHADIFAPAGTYPVVVQGICGAAILNQVFVVTVDSCIEVNLVGGANNYDLQSVNGLPGPGTPICVVLHIFNGATVSSPDPNNACLTTGNLDAQSHVGIDNMGVILAPGGDGAAGGNFSQFGFPGEDGGDAISLTVKTTIQNNGYIYAGGGGGGSVGLGVNIPILGNLAIGGGGGGGSASGEGGKQGLIPIPIFADGTDATPGLNSVPGVGGVLNVPIAIPIQAVTITITPVVFGGDGGGFGQPGTDGSLYVNIQVAVPFLGTIFNANFPNPPPSIFPAGGEAGYMIRRNNNLLIGLPDGYYQSTFLKGTVGP